MDSISGAITGNPAASGTSQFTVQVRDATGASASQTLSLTIALSTLSINGGSNTAQVAYSTPVSLAFTLYDSVNGADGISWAQFYFADSSGTPLCYGNWGRPDGLTLYDGDVEGTTWGFGIPHADSFCTVSLGSITNSPTDPNRVTVVLNISFNPGPGGAYSVLTQVNYATGVTGPWQEVGIITVDEASLPVLEPPTYEPPPVPEPLPTPPPPVSATGQDCSDISVHLV